MRSTFDHSTYAGGQSYYRALTPWTAYSPSHDGGFKTYVLASADGIPGDFNNNGTVDAGDYDTWRKNKDTSNALANDNGLGTPVGSADYNLWSANFGKPPGAGSGSGLAGAAVPEPRASALLLLSALCITLTGRRYRMMSQR